MSHHKRKKWEVLTLKVLAVNTSTNYLDIYIILKIMEVSGKVGNIHFDDVVDANGAICSRNLTNMNKVISKR
jgi:hypothetical protein